MAKKYPFFFLLIAINNLILLNRGGLKFASLVFMLYKLIIIPKVLVIINYILNAAIPIAPGPQWLEITQPV